MVILYVTILLQPLLFYQPLSTLIIQLTEQSDASVDPVILIPVDGQFDAQHIVGGVTGSGQCTTAGARLVYWAQTEDQNTN